MPRTNTSVMNALVEEGPSVQTRFSCMSPSFRTLVRTTPFVEPAVLSRLGEDGHAAIQAAFEYWIGSEHEGADDDRGLFEAIVGKRVNALPEHGVNGTA